MQERRYYTVKEANAILPQLTKLDSVGDGSLDKISMLIAVALACAGCDRAKPVQAPRSVTVKLPLPPCTVP